MTDTVRKRRADALQQIIAEHATVDMTNEACRNLALSQTKGAVRQDQITKRENLRVARDLWLRDFMRDFPSHTRA